MHHTVRLGRIAVAIALATVGLVPTLTRAAGQTGARPGNVAASDWIQLFNGRDLADWTIKFAKHELGENLHNTFRVEDGLLKIRYDAWPSFNGEFGHIFYKDPFSYYLIAAEYRFVGEQVAGAPAWAMRNNGLMLHSPSPRTMLRDQDFPIALEIQLLGGLGKGPRTTANLCTPGSNVVYQGKLHTPHCTNSTSQTYDGDQWVRVEVLVHGDELVRHIVDGQTVLEYLEAADWWRRGQPGRSCRQDRWHADDRRLHLAAGGDGADRLPEGRTAQPRRVHRRSLEELSAVHRQVEPGHVPLTGHAFPDQQRVHPDHLRRPAACVAQCSGWAH